MNLVNIQSLTSMWKTFILLEWLPNAVWPRKAAQLTELKQTHTKCSSVFMKRIQNSPESGTADCFHHTRTNHSLIALEPSRWWNPDWSAHLLWKMLLCIYNITQSLLSCGGPRGLITLTEFGGPWTGFSQTYGFRLCVLYNRCQSRNDHPAFLIKAHPYTAVSPNVWGIRTVLCFSMWCTL